MAKYHRQVSYINELGIICHRSRNFCFEQASEIVQVMNLGVRYEARVVRARTRSEAFFVEFWPHSPALQQKNRSREIAKRMAKAIEEGPSYQFTDLTGDGSPCMVVKSTSGAEYFLFPGSCGCEDFKKAVGAEVPCKHLIAARTFGGWK